MPEELNIWFSSAIIFYIACTILAWEQVTDEMTQLKCKPTVWKFFSVVLPLVNILKALDYLLHIDKAINEKRVSKFLKIFFRR